ncbi:hypothetical protein RW115_12055 [Macrococcus capreoli]
MVGFGNGLNKAIVQGINQGYLDYILERVKKENEMIISDAYSYMKGNHIDTAIAETLSTLMSFTKKSAGPSWKYLEFNSLEEDSDKRFIVKNEKYFDPQNVSKGKDINDKTKDRVRQYLKDYISDNPSSVSDLYVVNNDSNQLVLNLKDEGLIDAPVERKNNSLAYIVTYNIDSITMRMDTIKVWLPIPDKDEAILVDDLTELLREIESASPSIITEEHIKVLSNDVNHYELDATEYGISLDIEEEAKK